MPEDLALVEHIDDVEKRLKEMKYDDPMPLSGQTGSHPPIIQNVGEVSYIIPNTVDKLQEIITIIKTHPGDEIIRIGDGAYKINEIGKQLLVKLLGN
jgi:hypothetical protein